MQPATPLPMQRHVVSPEAFIESSRHLTRARAPWFVLRDQVGARFIEDLRVSRALYALLRQATKNWAKRAGLNPDPDAQPHGECDLDLPRSIVTVVVEEEVAR